MYYLSYKINNILKVITTFEMFRLYIFLVIIPFVNAVYPLPHVNVSYGLCYIRLTHFTDSGTRFTDHSNIVDCVTKDIILSKIRIFTYSNCGYLVLDNRYIITGDYLFDAKTRTIKLTKLVEHNILRYYEDESRYRKSGELIEEWYMNYYKNRYTFHAGCYRNTVIIERGNDRFFTDIGTHQTNSFPILFDNMYIFLIKKEVRKSGELQNTYNLFDENMNMINKFDMSLTNIRNNHLIFQNLESNEYYIYDKQTNITSKLNGTINKYTLNNQTYDDVNIDDTYSIENSVLKSEIKILNEKQEMLSVENKLLKIQMRTLNEKLKKIMHMLLNTNDNCETLTKWLNEYKNQSNKYKFFKWLKNDNNDFDKIYSSDPTVRKHSFRMISLLIHPDKIPKECSNNDIINMCKEIFEFIKYKSS